MYITYLSPLQSDISSFIYHLEHINQNYSIINRRLSRFIKPGKQYRDIKSTGRLKLRRLAPSKAPNARRARTPDNTPRTPVRTSPVNVPANIHTPRITTNTNNDIYITPKKIELNEAEMPKTPKKNSKRRSASVMSSAQTIEGSYPARKLIFSSRTSPASAPARTSPVSAPARTSPASAPTRTSPARTSPASAPTRTSPTRTSPTRTSPTRTSPTRTSPTRTPTETPRKKPESAKSSERSSDMRSSAKVAKQLFFGAKGGYGSKNDKKYTYKDIINVWHLFDTKHDFNIEYPINNNKINGINITSELKELYKTKPFEESRIVHELMQHTINKNENFIRNNLFNLKIYYENKQQPFILKKNVFEVHQNVPNTIKQFLFKDQDKSQNFYLQDIHINNIASTPWHLFQNKILENISNKVTPFEKRWDPLVSIFQEETVAYPCKSIEDTQKRIDTIYNLKNTNHEKLENEFAFRELTKKYLNISFKCEDTSFKGISIILTNPNDTNLNDTKSNIETILETIKNTYVVFIQFIKSKKYFDITVNNDKQICINCDINGFTINNINTVIELLNNESTSILTNLNYLKKYSTYDELKTLILFFICHIYLKPLLNIDKIKEILYDLKKSGDWGQALYCKYMNDNTANSTTCFVSGDFLSAFYSVINDVPTIIGSSTPKNDQEKYHQLNIFTGDKEFNFSYIENIIITYMQNDLLNNIKQYKNLVKDINQFIVEIETIWSTQISNFLNPNLNIPKEQILFKNYMVQFFNYILKPKPTNTEQSKEDPIRYIFIEFLNIYDIILKFFIKTNTELENYKLDKIKELIINYYDKKREELYNNNLTAKKDMKTIQKACFDGMYIFKEALNYCYDIIYIIYFFYIDNRIYYALQKSSENIINYLINTRAFLHQNPNIKSLRTTYTLSDMIPDLKNPHSNLLQEILQKEMFSQNSNPIQKAEQELKNILKFYEIIFYDINTVISAIRYDIIDKILNISDDTGLESFKIFFKQLILPKIYNALMFNIDKNIDDLCKKLQLSVDDCNKIRETFPVLSNYNSIYVAYEFILIILHNLTEKVKNKIRPFLLETINNTTDKKIAKQIQEIDEGLKNIIKRLNYKKDSQKSLIEFIKQLITNLKSSKKLKTSNGDIKINASQEELNKQQIIEHQKLITLLTGYKKSLIYIKKKTKDKSHIDKIKYLLNIINNESIVENTQNDEESLRKRKRSTVNIDAESDTTASNSNLDDNNIFSKSKNIYNMLIKIENVKKEVEQFKMFTNIIPV